MDIVTSDGLQTKTLAELISELTNSFIEIYGSDVNFDPNTPDGQLINILCQAGVDLREVLQQVNASFDPDQAAGSVLDQRVAINGLARGTGTFTTVLVDIQTDRAVSLIGLDSQIAEIDPIVQGLYTVRDGEGHLFYLSESVNIVSAGTETLEFRAAELGAVGVSVGAIDTAVTVLAGIVSIINTGGALVAGVDEESDADLRLRRQRSTGISSTGFTDALYAALVALPGVTTAIISENMTAITDENGTPGHTIWVIIEGGADEDIGTVIYKKKTAGCGMRGEESAIIPRLNGGDFTALFDRPINVELYIDFTLTYPLGNFDADWIKEQIVENVIWDVGGYATGDKITSFVKSINPAYQITNMSISDDDTTYVEVISPESPQHRFVNSTTRITINT